MKFQVIGWTYYEDDYPVHEGDEESVIRAVIEAIREGGFKFGGNSHDSALSGVPVLNDGTMACFSWRTWGGIMAEALRLPNNNGMAYTVWYMDNRERLLGETPREIVLPPRGVDKARIVPRETLAETFEMHLVPAAFQAVKSGEKTVEIRRFDEKRLLVCKDDFIDFLFENEHCLVRVKSTDTFPFRTLLGTSPQETEWERERLKEGEELLKRAAFAGYETPEKLREFLKTTYPNEQTAIVFEIERVQENNNGSENA